MRTCWRQQDARSSNLSRFREFKGVKASRAFDGADAQAEARVGGTGAVEEVQQVLRSFAKPQRANFKTKPKRIMLVRMHGFLWSY